MIAIDAAAWEAHNRERERRGLAPLPPPAPAPGPAARFGDRPRLPEWTYLTEARIAADAAALASELPDVDLVVAIPRSGLLPGSIVAYRRHVPLWTASRQSGVVAPGNGFRLDGREAGAPRRVLLIDDTIATGRELAACEPLVRARFPDAEIVRAVVYADPASLHRIDHCFAVSPNHLLAWNWPNAGHITRMGLDFDGILCRDDDPEFRPLYLPRRGVVPLVATGRHESERGTTEAWLARWGVRCDRLVMRDWGAVHEFDAARIAAMKGAAYRDSDLTLFAESDPGQAKIVAEVSGKAVLCPAAETIHPPRPAPPPATPAPAAAPPTTTATGPPGPGTILKEYLKSWGFSACSACDARAAAMDREGPAGVRANLDAHVAEIKARAKLVPALLIRERVLWACDRAEALAGA